MKHIFFLLFIFVSTLFAQQNKSHTFVNTFELLHQINNEAIILGDGTKDVYIFIDPLCRFSRKFIKTVTSKSIMLKKYKYHLFLYAIPKLHSQTIIYHIYHQKQPLKTLLAIMVQDKQENIEQLPYTQEKDRVNSIALVAKKLRVTKRPFIIISEERE